MKHWLKTTIAASLLVPMAVGQSKNLPVGSVSGVTESGALILAGYLVKGMPCIPLKKFAADVGVKTNVSPSRKAIAVITGTAMSLVTTEAAAVKNTEIPLSVKPFEKNGDLYVSLEFFEKAFPHKFTYHPNKKTVTAEFQGRILTIPLVSLEQR